MTIGRIAYKGTLNGTDENVNVFTVDAVGDFGAVVPSAVENWIDTMFTANFLAEVSPQVNWSHWQIEVPVSGHWVFAAGGDYLKVGTASGDSLPYFATYVILGLTPSRRRGKKFISGVPESDTGGGVITSGTVISHLSEFATGYVTPFDTTSSMGILTPGVCHPDGSNFLAFNGFHVDELLGSQVRRKIGRGA